MVKTVIYGFKLNIIKLSLCRQAGTKKRVYGWPAFNKKTKMTFFYSYRLDHIYNQTLALNSLSLKWFNFILKNLFWSGRDIYGWRKKKKKKNENKLLINMLTMKVRFSYCPKLQGQLKCFISYSLTSINTFLFF